MIEEMEKRNGYMKCTRGNGSVFYLCDSCETIAHLTTTEEEMSEHVRQAH